jgi:cell wall-associated NlpC family hydrolase
MDCAAKIRFAIELQRIIDLAPPYKWGGTTDEGLDCSGFVYLAAKRAGLPVTRSTSLRMSQGFEGWGGENVKFEAAVSLDIVFWTWSGRKNGHCGVLFQNQDGKLVVAHASFTKGVIVVPMVGTFIKNLSLIRRLS